MPREARIWHPRFIRYINTIANHPNYQGLPINRKRDGSYAWVDTKKSQVGQGRMRWALDRAREMGFDTGPGVYADVMLALHPTKWKVCQTCGREMSLYYHYPNYWFLVSLNRTFGTGYTDCDHIRDIWEDLTGRGFRHTQVAQFMIGQGGLNLPVTADRDTIIDALEYVCRKGSKNCLGPGAMSNFPDRFDGFHSYNRCCRATQDKGRSKANLRSYTKDRRAYEYWSDGNIHAANQFMGSPYFDGISADHIGPISLGFIHDPRYLQPMESGENSAKRDRLLLSDIEKIIETESRTGVYPMSWHSRLIWEHIKANYAANPEKISGIYRDALKQNMANFLYVLYCILDQCPENGEDYLTAAFLQPHFDCFNYSYSFAADGTILSQSPRHFTERSRNETLRYCRIAIESLYDYMEKDNRNTEPYLTPREIGALNRICALIGSLTHPSFVKLQLQELMEMIQGRLISAL